MGILEEMDKRIADLEALVESLQKRLAEVEARHPVKIVPSWDPCRPVRTWPMPENPAADPYKITAIG